MGAGKIIGGIFLIIFGIIIYGVSDWANTQTYYEVDRCNSLLGELGQGLSQDTYESCQNMSIVNSVSNVGIAVAVIFFLIGLILIIVGSIRGKRDKKIVKEDIKNPNTSVNSKDAKEIREKIGEHSTTAIQQERDTPIRENNIMNITKENSNNNDYLSRLEKLAEIKKNGTITEEEFNMLKGNILKNFDNTSIETTKLDSLVTNNKSKESSKDSEKQRKIRRYTSEGKPIYE
jgi:hypothetical protein